MKSPTSRLLLATGLTALAASLLAGCNKAPETPAAAPAAVVTPATPADSAITASVKSALQADPAIQKLDLQVETRKGTVQLSGFVDSQGQSDQAARIARATEGAIDIQNDLRIKQ